jgi:hypothetical protein
MGGTKRPKAINILFIGNSFTQRNDLPRLLAEMAAAQDLCVKHELISVGGASLRTHWNAGRAAKAIAKGEYDFVVLQEQSTLPVKNAKRMAENIRLFDESIKRAGSKTVLYMTWARQHAPESQKAIADAYNSIGDELVLQLDFRFWVDHDHVLDSGRVGLCVDVCAARKTNGGQLAHEA